jgi:hypothetical protein
MKILKCTLLFVLVPYVSLIAQVINKEILYSLDENFRKNELIINKHVILPKGDLVGFDYHYLDTTRFSHKSRTIKDKKKIKEIISLLEQCEITDEDYEMSSNTDLTIQYADREYFYLLPGYGTILFSNSDSTVTLKDNVGLTDVLNAVEGYKEFDIKDIKNIDKITLSYKKNKRVIRDPKLIGEFIALFENAKPTYATKCPFYNSRIYFEANGVKILAAPAHDACNIIIIGGTYFEMDKTLHSKFIFLMKRYVGFQVGP